MENKFFIDDLAYDEAECEEKYDHRYLGQEGLRELIGIIKYQLRELKSISDEHDFRLQDLENAVAVIEDRLNANDERLNEFAVDMESSEPLTIEQAVDAILQYARDIDSIEFGSEVLSVQEAFDLVEDQIADVESDLQEQIDKLGSEFDGVLEELEDSVVKSIEYNGESFKPEDIYDKPQPEDLSVEYDESDEGYVRQDDTHYVIKAISKNFKFTKELEKGIIEYDFGAKCLDEHNFVNKEGYGFKLTLGDAIIDSTTGAVNATEVGELDDHNFFESDTLKAVGTVEVDRVDEPLILTLTWLLQTPPLDDPDEELKVEYTFSVPALGDDVYRENVVVIPTDIDLSDATVKVGEGSEEERKTIKEAIDDLHQAIKDEEEARKSEDSDLQDEIDQLDNEAIKVVKVAGEPLEKDSEGAVNIERADALMVEAGEDHQLIDQTVSEHLNALYNEDKALSDDIAEILDEIGKIIQISYQVVEELPETGEPGVIYLIKMESSEGDNIYEEYIFLGEGSEGHFELIGSTRVDLGDIYEKLDELKERLDNFDGSGETIEDNLDELKDSISSLEDAIDGLNNRLDDFDGSGETIEEVINDLVDQLNTQLETIIERIGDLEELIQSGVVSDVAVNNVLLEKDSEGKVNIPLVSQEYDGVVPKFSGVPEGYLQDGDIILVLRNNTPTWTEVDIYSLEPDVEPTLAISYARCGYPYSGGIMDDISLDPLAVQEETHAYYWINSGIRTDEPIQFEISVNTPVIDNLNIDPSLGDPSIELGGYNNWQFINNVTLDSERKVLVFWLTNGGNETDSGNIDIVFHTEGGQELTVSIVVETRG